MQYNISKQTDMQITSSSSSLSNVSNKKQRGKIACMLERSRNQLNRVDQHSKDQEQLMFKDKGEEVMQKSFHDDERVNKTGVPMHFTIHKNNIDIKPLGYHPNAQYYPQPIHPIPYQSNRIQSFQSHYIKSNHSPLVLNNNTIRIANNSNNTKPTIHYQGISYHQSISNTGYNFSQVKPYVYLQQQVKSVNFIKSTQPKQFHVDDEQWERPLRNKLKMNKVQKSTLISDQQIKKGFNNNFQLALNKVNKKQQHQQLNNNHPPTSTPVKKEIQIISNLVHESYSPQQHIKNIPNMMSSSQKKKRKRIFQQTQNKLKAISMYQRSNVSFGTPQSMRMVNNKMQHSVFEYELMTEQGEEERIMNGDRCGDEKEQEYEEGFPRQLVPAHILSAWQRKANHNR